MWFDILGNHSPSPNHRPITYHNPRQNNRLVSDPHTITDHHIPATVFKSRRSWIMAKR
jgi:hypothetical protein